MANKHDSGQSFYDMIMNDAQELMVKQASADPEVLENILSESDLSESDLSKIASQLDEMLEADGSDELFEEEADNEATEDEDLGTDADEDTGIEDEGVIDEGAEIEEESVDDESEEENTADEEFSEEDLIKLAEHYEELHEKYASEDRGVADYVYDQLGNPDDEAAIKLATMIGESAEKLAYVTEISPYAVADDILTAVAATMTEEVEDVEE